MLCQLELFNVTRYDKSVSKRKKRRGRPRTANPKTPAERMRAYRERKRKAGLKNVRRWEPADDPGDSYFSDHRILDARSLAMHCMIARKIARDPRMLDKARQNLQRWIEKSGSPAPPYLLEWKAILDRPWPDVAALITSMHQDATRLRSSSPFAGVLTEEERDRIYAAFRA